MNPEFRPDAQYIKMLHETFGKAATDWYTRVPFYHLYLDTYEAFKDFSKEHKYFDPIKYLPLNTWISFSVDTEIAERILQIKLNKYSSIVSKNIVFRADLTDNDTAIEITMFRVGHRKVKRKHYFIPEILNSNLIPLPNTGELSFKNIELRGFDVKGTGWDYRIPPKMVKELQKTHNDRHAIFNAVSSYINEQLGNNVSYQIEVDMEDAMKELNLPEHVIKQAIEELAEQPMILLQYLMGFITMLAYANFKKLSRVAVQRPTTKKDTTAKLKKPWVRKDLPSIIYLDALPRDPKPHQGGTHKSPIPHPVQPHNRVLKAERYGRNRGKIIQVKGHSRGGDVMSSEYRGSIYTVSPEWKYLDK